MAWASVATRSSSGLGRCGRGLARGIKFGLELTLKTKPKHHIEKLEWTEGKRFQ